MADARRRRAAAALATFALAFAVAALVRRAPPDFARLPVVALVRDNDGHPLWAIRLARAAHQIEVDSLGAVPPPPGHQLQLWLAAVPGTGPHPLGLLPQSGRKDVAVPPGIAARLAGPGRVVVTVEPKGGSPTALPSGAEVFHAKLDGAKSADPVGNAARIVE